MIRLKSGTMRFVYVDFLCWESLLKLWQILHEKDIDKIYYINISMALRPFMPLLSKIKGKSFDQIDWIVEGEEKIGGISLYEKIQIELNNVIEKWVAQNDIFRMIEEYSKKHGYNSVKIKEYIKTNIYPHLFRPIEIKVISQKMYGGEKCLYLLRETPFSYLLTDVLGKEKTIFYNDFISHRLPIKLRRDYYYDSHFKKEYYFDRFDCIRKNITRYLVLLLNYTINFYLGKMRGSKFRYNHKQINICVETTQKIVRLDSINDIYWFKGSGINPENICLLESVDYDHFSNIVLSSLAIKRFKIFNNPFKLIKQFLDISGGKKYLAIPILPESSYFIKAIKRLLAHFLILFGWTEAAWLCQQMINFAFRTDYWESIYSQIGSRMLWSMFDGDLDKLCKAQALERLNGFYMGSHWSNFPMCKIDNQQCYDVFFTWGSHFEKNIFNQYPFMKVFQVGYHSDHYFANRKIEALKLRDSYPDKFILSYQDNIMANDIAYSKGMQLAIYSMLNSILKLYDNVVIFLKPKRKLVLNEILRETPQLGKYIDEGRVRIFLGGTSLEKAVPAEVGMASDLVIGLGISTPASECFFAGTLSFHADFTGFLSNDFSNKGLNKVVFRDIDSLQKAIENRITGADKLTYSDYAKYYKTLDPFQDGKAYLRTGFVIKKLQEALLSGMHRDEAVKYAVKEYDNSFEHAHSLG